ncbi:hypothetical protein COCNU_15G001420 [Cocos nucifera]|uniref:Uncharacterized protein n=1 Tax=Cocos nucifera TaxID=13894 RepID=A0A8K0ND60_COCNU|nr:hypothetical protein COCNU_15G001420 [Cocos nucifera]
MLNWMSALVERPLSQKQGKAPATSAGSGAPSKSRTPSGSMGSAAHDVSLLDRGFWAYANTHQKWSEKMVAVTVERDAVGNVYLDLDLSCIIIPNSDGEEADGEDESAEAAPTADAPIEEAALTESMPEELALAMAVIDAVTTNEFDHSSICLRFFFSSFVVR